MAYTNNGDYRHLELSIKIATNGINDTLVYSLLPAFTATDGTSFPEITVPQAQQMAHAQWQERVAKFIRYAEAQAGIDYEPAVVNSPYGSGQDVDAPQGMSCPVAAW